MSEDINGIFLITNSSGVVATAETIDQANEIAELFNGKISRVPYFKRGTEIPKVSLISLSSILHLDDLEEHMLSEVMDVPKLIIEDMPNYSTIQTYVCIQENIENQAVKFTVTRSVLSSNIPQALVYLNLSLQNEIISWLKEWHTHHKPD